MLVTNVVLKCDFSFKYIVTEIASERCNGCQAVRFVKMVMIRMVFLQMDIKEFNILEIISAQNARNSGRYKHMSMTFTMQVLGKEDIRLV